MALSVVGNKTYHGALSAKADMRRIPALLKSGYSADVIERKALTGEDRKFYDVSSLLWTGLFEDSPRIFMVKSLPSANPALYRAGLMDFACFSPTAYEGPSNYKLGIIMHEFRHRVQFQQEFGKVQLGDRSVFKASGIFDDHMVDVVEFHASYCEEIMKPRELDSYFVGMACGMIEDLRALMISDPSLLKDILFMSDDTSEEVLKRLSGFTNPALFSSAGKFMPAQADHPFQAIISARWPIPTSCKL